MIGRWRRTVQRMWAPEGGLPLAAFRVLVAVAVLSTVGSAVTHDLIDMVFVDDDFGGYRNLGRGPWLVAWLGGPTPSVVWGLVLGALVSGVALLAGLGGRVTAFLALQVFMALTDLNGHAGGSYDELIKNALWLCVLTPTTATLSADAWILRGRPWRGRPVPAWARAVIVFQIVLVYWTTGLQKVSAYWTPGGDLSALYYILQQPSWQRFDLSFLAWLFPLTQLATFVTWLWEVTAPLWLLALHYRATRIRPGRLRALSNSLDLRTVYVAVGLFFHAALLVTLEVGPFPLISLAFYPCFWTHEELATMARRAGRALGLTGRSGPGGAPSASPGPPVGTRA